MALLITNNATGTLASNITNSQTTIPLSSGNGALFPSPSGSDWFPVTLYNAGGTYEICKCTSRSGDTLTVVRAQEGTAGFGFSSGDKCDLRLTAAGIANKLDKDTGGVIGGNVNISTAVANRIIGFQTSGVARWQLTVNSTAESGGNAGSDFVLFPYNDAGTVQTAAIFIPRSTGVVNALVGLQVAGVNVVDVSSTQTLTNKTLTSPTMTGPIFGTIVNSGTLTLPTSSDTLVGRATTDTLTNKTISSGVVASSSYRSNEVGYMGLPQNTSSTNYTLVQADAGTSRVFSATATCGIPANASVAFDLETQIKIVAAVGAIVTISITTDTLRWVPSGTTGSRTLTGPGYAILSKYKATEWWISGVGLT